MNSPKLPATCICNRLIELGLVLFLLTFLLNGFARLLIVAHFAARQRNGADMSASFALAQICQRLHAEP